MGAVYHRYILYSRCSDKKRRPGTRAPRPPVLLAALFTALDTLRTGHGARFRQYARFCTSLRKVEGPCPSSFARRLGNTSTFLIGIRVANENVFSYRHSTVYDGCWLFYRNYPTSDVSSFIFKNNITQNAERLNLYIQIISKPDSMFKLVYLLI